MNAASFDRRDFGRRWRLAGRRRFAAIHAAKVRRESGPLLVYGLPNELNHLRLGLSVGRRVGNAVARQRIKRLLREAFRHHRTEWPTGYDLLVVVRPHRALAPDEYAMDLQSAIEGIDRTWRRRTTPNEPNSA